MANGQSSIQFPSNFFEEFPILNETVNGKRLIYLDNAATTQTPSCVVERILQHYQHDNANVHRATHTLSNRSTIAYENAREGVARYLNAPSADCIVFTREALINSRPTARRMPPNLPSCLRKYS